VGFKDFFGIDDEERYRDTGFFGEQHTLTVARAKELVDEADGVLVRVPIQSPSEAPDYLSECSEDFEITKKEARFFLGMYPYDKQDEEILAHIVQKNRGVGDGLKDYVVFGPTIWTQLG